MRRSEESRIHELACILRADLRRFFDAAGQPLPVEQLSPDDRAAIQTWTNRRTTDEFGDCVETEIVLRDKVSAASELLALLEADRSAGPQRPDPPSPVSDTVKFRQ